jgi:hypothetical protein
MGRVLVLVEDRPLGSVVSGTSSGSAGSQIAKAAP